MRNSRPLFDGIDVNAERSKQITLFFKQHGTVLPRCLSLKVV